MMKGNSWDHGCVKPDVLPCGGWGSATGELCTMRCKDVQRDCSLSWAVRVKLKRFVFL